jgi:phage baseplate assembly protein W
MKKIYFDIDSNLTKNVISDDIGVKYDLNAISQSIKTIILTNKNEKLFNLKFGTNANLLDFSSLLPFQLDDAKMLMFGELQLQEPRAIIQNIDIKNTGFNSWIIDIAFTPVYDKNISKTVTIQA